MDLVPALRWVIQLADVEDFHPNFPCLPAGRLCYSQFEIDEIGIVLASSKIFMEEQVHVIYYNI